MSAAPDPSPAPLTPSELSALVELEKKATPEPWHSAPRTADCARIWSEHRASDGVHPPLDELSAMLMWPAHPNEPAAEAAAVDVTFANAELIAALRNAAPRLFAELLALREENERLRRVLDTIYAHDRTPEYTYGEPLRNGTKPGAGKRFLTPRELVNVERINAKRAQEVKPC